MCVRAQPQRQDGCDEWEAEERVAEMGSIPPPGLALILMHWDPQTWYLPPFPAANPAPQNHFFFFPPSSWSVFSPLSNSLFSSERNVLKFDWIKRTSLMFITLEERRQNVLLHPEILKMFAQINP